LKTIKLDAIDSTNSFLKKLAQESVLENFTVVTAESQISGRGQQQQTWHSEANKNLTISIYTSFKNLNIYNQKYLNFAISIAIYETLSAHKIPDLSIKWPNDILSANKKLCGILVENMIKGMKIQSSIIGIGLNVNQEKFPSFLTNATSIKNCIKKETDLDVLLHTLVLKLKEKIEVLNTSQFPILEEGYLSVLYKKNIPTMFKDCNNVLFIGIIKNISSEGKLQIQLEDDSVKEFGIKEVSFA
jgi:BirA family biotin operon repressor/biotin-[acetyl-CoA-carboxylase] ligase